MREIKFRVWDNDEMHYNDLGAFVAIEEMSLHPCDCILMQYTGLKDKNSVEIYEGDIIQYNDGLKVKVIFKDGVFFGYDGYALSSDEAYTLLVANETPFNGFDFELEVIGNIHEKKDLLKP